MRIALIQCPLWGTFDPPIGLAQMASFMKSQGHEVAAWDINIKAFLSQPEERKSLWAWEKTELWTFPDQVQRIFSENLGVVDRCIDQMLGRGIRLCGISVNSASYLFSLEFARRLKSRDGRILVALGGPFFLKQAATADALREDCVDFVIAGEGLAVFAELARRLDSGADASGCPGVACKGGGAVAGQPPPPSAELDALPFLDFSDLPLGDYDTGNHISLMTSRGCPRQCHFCSCAPCWPGYRVMSGRRIFEEVRFHKEKLGHGLGHVDFVDLAFNGNMESLSQFCALMDRADLDLSWTANMYVRPEMKAPVIAAMARARCRHVILGIESGSERVLKLMNKHYRIADAERMLRELFHAGICVTANFMFGFPGETEEDFQLTLDFLRRNARYMGVYPSRTYCALEENSLLAAHPERFAIKPSAASHIFWESSDGRNTYPVRMDRCQRFCRLAAKLGVGTSAGVQTTVPLEEWLTLGAYYELKGDIHKAIQSLAKYLRRDPCNQEARRRLEGLRGRIPSLGLDRKKSDGLRSLAEQTLSRRPAAKAVRRDRPLSPVFLSVRMTWLADHGGQEDHHRDRPDRQAPEAVPRQGLPELAVPAGAVAAPGPRPAPGEASETRRRPGRRRPLLYPARHRLQRTGRIPPGAETPCQSRRHQSLQ